MLVQYAAFALCAASFALALPQPAKHQLDDRGLGDLLAPVTGLLLGPVTLPPDTKQVTGSLVNFNDEVIDISSISVFGDINDGGCAEAAEDTTPATHAGRQVLLGPVSPYEASQVQNANVGLVNFNDEVVDISSISIFGDINDGAACPGQQQQQQGQWQSPRSQ